MKKVSEYHGHASECREMAGRTTDPQHKATLIKMAETWENLAREREELVARKQRIADLEVPASCK